MCPDQPKVESQEGYRSSILVLEAERHSFRRCAPSSRTHSGLERMTSLRSLEGGTGNIETSIFKRWVRVGGRLMTPESNGRNDYLSSRSVKGTGRR